MKNLLILSKECTTPGGPELTALAVPIGHQENGIELEFISPGKPMQNGLIERFNRSYREAVLDMYIFETLEDVKTETEKWLAFTISIARMKVWAI